MAGEAPWSANLINAGASSPRIYNASRVAAYGMAGYDAISGGYHIASGANRVYHGDNWGYLEAAGGALSVFGSAASVRELSQPKLGGAFGELDKTLGDRHHAPAKAAVRAAGGDTDLSPAFLMDAIDHAKTASYATVRGSKKYRDTQTALLRSGNFSQAMAMDVADVLQNPAIKQKYAQGIQEMMNYARRIGLIR